MDREAWHASVHGVAKSQTWLSNWTKQLNYDHGLSAINSWQIEGENVEVVTDFLFLGSKITANGDCSHKIRRHLLLGRKGREVTESCPILCDPMDCNLPGSSVHGIFQARTLEWVAISFSRGSSRPRAQTQFSRIACRHFTVWATREGKLWQT